MLRRPIRILHAIFCVTAWFAGSASVLAASPSVYAKAGDLKTIPAPDAVLSLMEHVANWQLAHPSTYPADDWTSAVGDAGYMALTGISGKTEYRAAMEAVGAKTRWRLGPSKFHADDQAVGQTFSELYLQLRDPKMIAPMRKQFDEMLAEPRPGTLNWNAVDVLHRWSWCDSLFMAPPAWARLTAATGNPQYLDFAIEQWWITSAYLYDEKEHLYFRDSRYFEQREANGQKVFWGRGNGWVMGGLVRMMQFIPASHPARKRFEKQYIDMAERIAGLQQSDGLWRASLLDPANYPNRESSGSALYTYALAWGVNQGLLSPEKYGPTVLRGWQALSNNVLADGKLVYVQPLGQDPKHFSPDSTDVFGVGTFLLAGSEIYRMGLINIARPQIITVSNDTPLHRLEESVEARHGGGEMAVMDGLTSRFLTSQTISGGTLFQTDLAPGESKQFLLFKRAQVSATPPPVKRAHARFVPERLDDFAWENDRIAHRTYGPAVLKDPGERLRSSGIDIWSKSAHKLVVDSWYRAGEYHHDKGEGLDFYSVGDGRGCGGLGIYDGKLLHTSSNFSQWKVLADGPLRAEFELGYDNWDAAGRMVAEKRRMRLDAGTNFTRVESTFASPSPLPLTVGIGIARQQGAGTFMKQANLLSYWGPPVGDDGSNACAVIAPTTKDIIVGDGQYLALAAAMPNRPFVYYLGAAWSKGGDYADAAAWERDVANTAARLATPVKVRISQ